MSSLSYEFITREERVMIIERKLRKWSARLQSTMSSLGFIASHIGLHISWYHVASSTVQQTDIWYHAYCCLQQIFLDMTFHTWWSMLRRKTPIFILLNSNFPISLVLHEYLVIEFIRLANPTTFLLSYKISWLSPRAIARHKCSVLILWSPWAHLKRASLLAVRIGFPEARPLE